MAQQPDYRGSVDLLMVEGDTFGPYIFKFRTGTDPDTYETLTGCTFLADLVRDGVSAIESTTANGRFTLTDTDEFTWTISATDAAVLEPGKYRYDIQVNYSGGVKRTRVHGTLTVKAQVSE